MNVILVAIGSSGDVFPFIGFGIALRERGHSVHIITSASFQEAATAAGLHYVEAFDSEKDALFRGLMVRIGAGKWIRFSPQEKRIFKLFMDVPARVYSLIEALNSASPSVLATTEIFTFGAGSLAHEKLSIPYATVWHSPVALGLLTPRLPAGLRGFEDAFRNMAWRCMPNLNRIPGQYFEMRARLGLPDRRNFVRQAFNSQALNIALMPPWFNPRLSKRLPNSVFTGFPLYAPGADEELQPELRKFLSRGDRPIVVTNASWRADEDEFFETSLWACSQLSKRVLVLGWRSERRHQWSSEKVQFVDFAPITNVTPHAEALISHGGIGTIAAGLVAGIPQLIVPRDLDQPINASLTAKLGVAKVMSPREYRATAAQAIESLLSSGDIRAACAEVAARFRPAPLYGEAIERLELLAAAR